MTTTHSKTPLPPRRLLTPEQREYKRIQRILDYQVAEVRRGLQDYVDTIIWDLSCNIADELYAAGRSPSFSSNISGDLTCGYGTLSSCGEFQFPLVNENYTNLIDK